MIRALIFDLDDTLYLERDFVFGGYRAVARHVSGCHGLSYQDAYRLMRDAFASDGRRHVMSSLLERFPIRSTIEELVQIYRTHDPEIRLFPGYGPLLDGLSGSFKLGIITDGMPSVQKKKVAALGLNELVDMTLCTWDYGRDKEKPHPAPFRLMLSMLRVNASQALFIGDNIEKDCRGAGRAGITNVLIGGALRGGKPQGVDYVIDSLFQLPQVIERCEAQNVPA